MNTNPATLVSFVIPVYNEEAVLPVLFERMDALFEKLDANAEVLLVNDGSVDASLDLLRGKSQTDPRYITRDLSRNFGHQIAITAGIDAAQGDAVIILDADLQDPPELALEMIALWRQGAQVVSARRRRREGETFFKRITAKFYYQLLSRLSLVKMPEDVGDFRLIDRQVVDALRSMKEHNRYLRGMISWVGYKHAEIIYDRQERAAGTSKYTLAKMALLASNGVIAFSEVPLRIALWFGLCVSMTSFAAVIWVLLGVILGGEMVSGWASTIIMLSLLSGVQLMTIGVVGLYVGRIYNEVKRRPLYFVNAELDAAGQPAAELSTTPMARQT